MKLGIKAAFAILALLAWAAPGWASAPNVMTYQGRLLVGGVPFNGTREVAIRFCDDPNTGVCVDAFNGGSFNTAPVSVTNGLFSIIVPLPVGVDLTTGRQYLQVAVAPNDTTPPTDLTPRERLTSSAYAIFSSTAATAFTLIAPSPSSWGARVSTHVILGGQAGDSNLGIGVANPTLALEVQREGSNSAIVAATGYGGSAPLMRLRKALGTFISPGALTQGFILGITTLVITAPALPRAPTCGLWPSRTGTPALKARAHLATTQNNGTVAQGVCASITPATWLSAQQ